MAQILEVNPDATLDVVRRQLTQWRRTRVALLLPDGWPALENAAQLRLLQRQAQLQRCHLGLITRDPTMRRAAAQVGVPTFVHPDDAQRDNWRMYPLLPLINPYRPDRNLPERPRWPRAQIIANETQPSHYRARQQRIQAEERYRRPLPGWLRVLGNVIGGLLIVALLALFVLYVIPAATITIIPGREPIVLTVPLTANPFLEEADLDFNQLPARLIERDIDATGSMRTTGTRQKATNPARGIVTFSNLATEPVYVPSGTLLSTGTGNAVNFRTTADLQVPGGLGQRADVAVEAAQPGTEGNVRANTITTVNGGLRLRVGVTNQNGTSGGGAALVAIVTQEDRDALYAQVFADAEAKAYAALQELLEPGEWLSPETIQPISNNATYSAFNDEEADLLELRIQLQVRGIAVDQAILREALLQTAQDAIPAQAKLVADSVTAERAPGVNFALGTVQFTMTVNGEYVIPIDPVEVRSAIAGLTPAAAIALVQQRWPLEAPPEIHRDPEWFATLPAIGNRIQVRIAYANQLASQ